MIKEEIKLILHELFQKTEEEGEFPVQPMRCVSFWPQNQTQQKKENKEQLVSPEHWYTNS